MDSNLHSEIREYLTISRQRHRVFPRAAVAGVFAGLLALLFRLALAGADTLREHLITWGHRAGALGWFLPVSFGAIGASVAVAITQKYAPEASGSGIPHLEAVLHRFRSLHWLRLLVVKFFGGSIAIASGLALGREGPTVQMGGAVGAGVAHLFKSQATERLVLISAGAGAGLGAVFNAPLSGLMFVVEELRRDFQPIVFGASFIACVIADVIMRMGTGQLPVFLVPSHPASPLGSLFVFTVLGVVAGLVGALFNRSLLIALDWRDRVSKRWVLPMSALVGGIVGLIGYFEPHLVGSGHQICQLASTDGIVLEAVPLFFILRFLMTITSYATGAPGGIFAPILALGALLGLFVGGTVHRLLPAVVPTPETFAVVGMAALFTGIVRAPITGITLIIEMTNSYQQMLSLLVSCFFAYIVAESLGDTPIYEALLERDLAQHSTAQHLKKPAVVEFTVEDGAPFAGKEVRSLGLPPGCILVSCSDGKREWVPRANTRLFPHMRITAMVAPEAEQAIEILHKGCQNSATSESTPKQEEQT